MDDNAMRQWLIECFGPIQGEMAWQQISQLPDMVRDQIMSQDPSTLPKPDQVQSLMQAFTAGGLNSMGDMKRTVEEGPINVKLAKSLALQRANGAGSETTVSAATGTALRGALSEANLWLDSACQFDPAPGEAQVLTRAGWVEGTLDAWAKFAAPVAASMGDALASVISERLGGEMGGEVAGMFAGPVPIPIPDDMKDPGQLMKLLGNTSFAMQLGQAAGMLSHEVRGGFDQGIALLANPAGALIAQNVIEYAKALNGEAPAKADEQAGAPDSVAGGSSESHPIGFVAPTADASSEAATQGDVPLEGIGTGPDIPLDEVAAYLALQETAHARLYASVPWLMPRFEALIGKYARGVAIDLDAMEEQLRDAGTMDPESISGAVNLTKVGIPDTPEQQEAMASLETLLALVEGWVDCVTWRAGMAHIPHIEQLREMTRRERAVGGPAERTFENLLGLELRPRRMREAASLWERITAGEGPEARDAKWGHPDLLPALPADGGSGEGDDADSKGLDSSGAANAASPAPAAASGDAIDWDAELSKLLDEQPGDSGDDNNPTDNR